MKKKRLITLFILITIFTISVYAGDDETRNENLITDDFELSEDIEVDAVTSATMSEFELENPVIEYSELEVYNMTIEAILALHGLALAMTIPLFIRKLRGKHIGSE